MSATRGLLVWVVGLLAAVAVSFAALPGEPPELAASESSPPRWPGLRFVASVDIDVDSMTLAAENAWAKAMRLMGHGPEDFLMGPLAVFVCADWKELRRLSWQRGRRDIVPVIGWYDRSGPAILFRHEPGRDELTIAHEMAHHAVAQLTSRCPPVVNEGLACLVTQIVLDDLRYGPRIDDQEARWSRRVRKAIRDDKLPSLWMLMRGGFYENTHLHYPLALCFARVLTRRSPDAMRTMMGRFDDDRAWTAFARAYAASDVRKEWAGEVRVFAR